MERVAKRAATLEELAALTYDDEMDPRLRVLTPEEELAIPEHEYGQHWSDWRHVAEGILASTPNDRQSEVIGYAHELAEDQLNKLVEERANQEQWTLEVTRLYIAYVEPNFVEAKPEYLTNFMKGLWDDDWSLAFSWTLPDDEGNVAKALGMASWPRYQPYMLHNVLCTMGLDTETSVSEAEARLFVEHRIFPHCHSQEDRAVFERWLADAKQRGVFDEAERQRLAQLGKSSDAPIVL